MQKTLNFNMDILHSDNTNIKKSEESQNINVLKVKHENDTEVIHTHKQFKRKR